MDETQNVGSSMRDYIKVVDFDMGASDAPVSCVPADMLSTRVTQLVTALRDLHAAAANGAITEEMLQQLDQACAIVCGVAQSVTQPQVDDNAEFVEESSPTTPDAMAPAVDQQGHRSYASPSGQSYAQQKGFTG